ncbi:hypothetical protein [Flavobacterium sp.]|jgi:hypothetical protein|uniref:hypothetical protein n=1 Tax=Flavobacterium sp. TaxID=239 RepID=UPI0037BE3BC9
MKIEELFNYFTEKTEIQIPQNIKENYLNDRNNNSEFVRLFKSNFDSEKKDFNPILRVLISERFAIEILKLIYDYPKQERYNILFNELEIYDIFYKGKKMASSLDSEKLIIEEVLYYVDHYDYKKNQFKFPLIQQAYKNLDSNPDIMKVVLILHGSCGGEGGIIVRGKNLGYDSGCVHGESSEIEFNEEVFEYEGYSFEKYERIHKPILENPKK